MSAQEVGRYMPAVITLDDLAADEHGHRYETSPETIKQMPLADLLAENALDYLA
jgi:hypothetical protein